MIDYYKADLYRYYGVCNFKIFILALAKIPGFRYTFLLRASKRHKNTIFLNFIFSFLLRHYQYKYGFQIHRDTLIGDGLYIGHFGNIIININAVIGKNCNLTAGVVIGQTNRGEFKGAPTIGNFVWIGANSIIVGKIKIGNNVLIAPGSFVNKDVPDNTIVIGNPARYFFKDNATEGYIENCLN